MLELRRCLSRRSYRGRCITPSSESLSWTPTTSGIKSSKLDLALPLGTGQSEKMKTLADFGRPPNPNDPLDPSFNPDEEPAYPESEPEDVPLPDQRLSDPPGITPITMYRALAENAECPELRWRDPASWKASRRQMRLSRRCMSGRPAPMVRDERNIMPTKPSAFGRDTQLRHPSRRNAAKLPGQNRIGKYLSRSIVG